MKALMLKDFYVLRKQFWLYALIVIVFQFTNNAATAFISVLYAALIPATAFAYDDRSKWDIMETMLPYSVRQIVLSRYCVGWIAAASLTVLIALTRLALNQIPVLPQFWRYGVFRDTLAQFALAACFMALSMPIYFRFDAEKGRVIRMFMIAMIVGGVGAGVGIMTIRDVAFQDQIISGGFESTIFPEYLAAILLTALSIPLSMLAWRRRHK